VRQSHSVRYVKKCVSLTDMKIEIEIFGRITIPIGRAYV
jgi:hypothetical protein